MGPLNGLFSLRKLCFLIISSTENPLCAVQVYVNLGFSDLIWTHYKVYKLRNTFVPVSVMCILISINLLLSPVFSPLSCEVSPHLYAILIHPALIDLTNLLSEPANTAARVHRCLLQRMLHSHRPSTPELLLFYNCPLTGRPWKTQLALQQSREVFPADSGEPICLVGMKWQAAGSGLSVMQCLYRAWAVSAITLNCHPHANDRCSKRRGVWWGGGHIPHVHFSQLYSKWYKEGFEFHKAWFSLGGWGLPSPHDCKPKLAGIDPSPLSSSSTATTSSSSSSLRRAIAFRGKIKITSRRMPAVALIARYSPEVTQPTAEKNKCDRWDVCMNNAGSFAVH